MIDLDEDAMYAAFDIVGRTGAKGLEIGFLHDDVPIEQAGSWVHAQYQGTRITEEDHRGPVEALEALARRLLTGARCSHCDGLVALSDHGATAYPGVMTDGTEWTAEDIRRDGQCRYRRVGPRWVPGCETRNERRGKPSAKRRKARRR